MRGRGTPRPFVGAGTVLVVVLRPRPPMRGRGTPHLPLEVSTVHVVFLNDATLSEEHDVQGTV